MRRRGPSCGLAGQNFSRTQSFPTAIILSEYVSLAHAFFEGPEPKFVNGVLEKIGKALRANDTETEADQT